MQAVTGRLLSGRTGSLTSTLGTRSNGSCIYNHFHGRRFATGNARTVRVARRDVYPSTKYVNWRQYIFEFEHCLHALTVTAADLQ